MAESKEYMTQPEENGSINISEEVIAAIAVGAVREVEGVSGIDGTQAALDIAQGFVTVRNVAGAVAWILILMLLVIAYFVLRTAIDDPEKKARFAAVFSVIAAVDAPISFMITRMIPSSVHPVVFRTDSGLPPDMLIPFLCGLFGMCLAGFGIYRLRLRVCEQSAQVEALKRRFEALDE